MSGTYEILRDHYPRGIPRVLRIHGITEPWRRRPSPGPDEEASPAKPSVGAAGDSGPQS